jgi:hypothetical protein
VISRVTGGCRTVSTMMAPGCERGGGVVWGAGAGTGAGCCRTLVI